VNFNEYQAAALRTAPQQEQLAGLVHACEGFFTEGGECMTEVKRMHQYGKAMTPEIHQHIVEEVGDLLWYVALAAEHLGVSLHSIAQQNIAKLTLRFPDKFSGEAALARADKGGLGHRES
jgi:NTP pyrophosphatase (non-canonical NTP hydrolase)